MAYDFSTLIPSASPFASAGLDPQEALASDDPYGRLAAAQAGVPYQAGAAVNRPTTRPVPPDHPGRSIITLNAAASPVAAVQRTGVSNPPDGGAVRSIDSPGYALPRPQDSHPFASPQPANNAPNPTSEKPSGPQAVPSSVTPSGGQSKFSDVARQMLAQKQQALNQAQAVPNAPDVGQLEQQRTAAVAAAPNPNDPNYKPSLKSRFLRGIEGVGLGLAEGGLRGAIAGGIAPQTTGLAGYRDPNSAFSRAKATSDQNVASLDQQLTAAQSQQKQANEQVNAQTGIAKEAGSGVSQATEAQNADKPDLKKYQIVTAGDGSLFRINPDDPTSAEPVLGPGGKQITGKTDSKYIPLEVNGQEHTFEVKPDGSKVDMGPTGQKPIRISTGGEGTWSLQEQDDGKGGTKTVLFNSKSGETKDAPAGLKKAGSTGKGEAATFKAFTPALDSAERVNIMTQNAEDALRGNQQAGLSLLSNHIGMTMGLVKGARINKEIYKEAEQSQPWLQGISAHWDKDGYLSGVALSPQQIGNMVDLAPGRMREDIGKARNESRYLGAKDDGPDRTPSRSTMRYYLFKTGGDKDKAKAAAAADGWTVGGSNAGK
jgi:hypothetical protein